MVSVVVFEFGCMRCQPLRRALSFFNQIIALKMPPNNTI
ncbi:acetyltransferase [Vibrio cholerae]|nr:acetyltransferase [Vibrio cholerae]